MIVALSIPLTVFAQTPVLYETAKLLANDGADRDYFGYSVAVSGTYALVGAWGDGDAGESSGSAYVFERQLSGAWVQTAKLIPADGSNDSAQFGISAAVGEGWALVGAFGTDVVGSYNGAAYVFEPKLGG